MRLFLHAPFGSRINRAWGLALRKRFCVGFGFELQAAAGEEAIPGASGEAMEATVPLPAGEGIVGPSWSAVAGHLAARARPGDIIVTGKNFGAGSSRQQAVDCFLALGISVIVAESFGAIYERNAINVGMPILRAPALAEVQDGETVHVDFRTGVVSIPSRGISVKGQPFSDVQLRIYERGGLLVAG